MPPSRNGTANKRTAAQARSRADLNGLKSTDPAAFNSEAEAAFIPFLCKLIADEGPITVRETLSEAAFELNVSIETAKRYLIKHTARRAHFSFTTDGQAVTCKPHAKAPRAGRT